MKAIKTLVVLSLFAACLTVAEAQTPAKDAKQNPAVINSKAKSTTSATQTKSPAARPKSAAEKPAIAVTVKNLEEQVVLYTLYRGSYDQIGPTIARLFEFAAQNQIQPIDPVCLAFLNNPKLVTSAHWLTEIRVPVDPITLNMAGSFDLITDIKRLPAMDVVSAVKPVGMADPASIYDALTKYIQENKYTPLDGPMEKYPQEMNLPYGRMETEIMIPIEKPAAPAATATPVAPATPAKPQTAK